MPPRKEGSPLSLDRLLMPTLTTPRLLFLGVVGFQLIMLGLFLRLFLWKRYAERRFWRRRPTLSIEGLAQTAQTVGRSLPRFAIVIPAREEAAVIERTVEQMLGLTYPAERFEVVVVTDAKERRSAAQRQTAAVNVVLACLAQGLPPPPAESQGAGLLLTLLGTLAIGEHAQVHAGVGDSDGWLLLQRLPDHRFRPLLGETAERLLGRGNPNLVEWLRRSLLGLLPMASEAERAEAQGALLALAIPVALAYCSLAGGDVRPLSRRLARGARAQTAVQARSLQLADRILGLLQTSAIEHSLPGRLEALFAERFPTTQSILAEKMAALAQEPGRPQVRHLEVPVDFDGDLGGRCLGVDVPSTRGRALNWAIPRLAHEPDWIGFYDAESRPDPQVLLCVAQRGLMGSAPRIFQGPVFQVRNWYDLSPFCKVASLLQAIAHDWFLPVLCRRIPFVGGTNLFVARRLLVAIGGFDASTLTEDLELGTRAFLLTGAWPEYLPYPCSEQTPPTFAGYYRQRLRWATGHLQVMAKIRRGNGCEQGRRRLLLRRLWRKGQAAWLFYQGAALVAILCVGLHLTGRLDPSVMPRNVQMVLALLSAGTLPFIFYARWRYRPHLDRTARPRRLRGRLAALGQLLLLPLACLLFPLPYASALLLAAVGRGPFHGVRTPRIGE
jgi:cellulose synthase/poly-beta-1,6-N-acetylglucosamine synthase-like glycosyltransferase